MLPHVQIHPISSWNLGIRKAGNLEPPKETGKSEGVPTKGATTLEGWLLTTPN
jgi:hypothetical protein